MISLEYKFLETPENTRHSTNEELGLAEGSVPCSFILCNDEKDKMYYAHWIVNQLNCDPGLDGDALLLYIANTLGIYMASIKHTAEHMPIYQAIVGLNIKNLLVSSKLIDRVKLGTIDKKVFHDNVSRIEQRMASRFRENYKIFMDVMEEPIWYGGK